MAETTIKLPDIGEGIAESEISEWMVSVGDMIREDDPLVTVLTDKAAVEIPSSVSGKVTWLAGEEGDVLAVGAPLVKIDVMDNAQEEPAQTASAPEPEEIAEEDAVNEVPQPTAEVALPKVDQGKALAAPAVRKRAAELGVDLSTVAGTGPEGLVSHNDLDRFLAGGTSRPAPVQDRVTTTKIIGMRRKIAEQMARSHASIPAITIVEEVDVTELERLRAQMNGDRKDRPKLTLLPFLIRAMDRARAVVPEVNSRYDDDAGVLEQHAGMHIGIATQTDNGLLVPVMRNAQAASVWTIAAEIKRLADGARDGTLSREDLSGSTITITSLGPLGAIATTPIINHPEVAILGVNRKQMRPLWDGQQFVPREVMNVSASFDHRIIDGWDAAQFIARLKQVLETPALLFTQSEEA
ncbi:dihydrolipoamide acetyltransferase family protein [Actibacterium pelagium]|uniref:Dihydrolipoamide acetyltransferase component of pyruvate dehydrogenase complex n=1 Tax=Actibacterium pelagium TaxID=2029103 RepID=A0A917EFN2_9RHOB|nr:dihydrolipoamide acetyltransferase family protein [Actibacterium pelagium]GGE37258.1 dihydrolipoamide acetyltransferase component of pyruvate dehydrogenase complex [Actibacterium pelagium]